MSVTEDIKARLDIVSFIGQFVQLKKAGRNYTARCPFHNERTPSFIVFPDSQNWRCFGACGEGGDIFNFVMKREGMDFPSALKVLAHQAGVELKAESPEQASAEQRLDKLRGLLDETARYYHEKLLESGKAAHARGYIRKRGITLDTIKRFQMGYSSNEWTELLNHLLKLGYGEEDVIDAGVAIRNDTGRVYDRFRNRLMIPIHDGSGKAIGFGARALAAEDNPKYLNSPQGPLFDKSATLFGLHHARRAIRESETAVIVEGYMDAIQAHQGGFFNVVAQMGTALTEPQLKQLSKYARRLILALDPDAAGAKATMRGLDVIRQASEGGETFLDTRGLMRQASRLDVDLRVMTLPDGQDPDDVIRQTPDLWRELAEHARPVADYVISVGTAGVTPESALADREKVARELLPILVATENNLQEQTNIQQLAFKLRLDNKVLMQWALEHRLKLTPRQTFVKSPTAKSTSPATTDSNRDSVGGIGNVPAPIAPGMDSATPPDPQPETKLLSPAGAAVERYCLAVLLRNPGWLPGINRKFREVANSARVGDDVLGGLTPQDFSNSDYRAIFSTLLDAMAQFEIEPDAYLSQNLPYELQQHVNDLMLYPLERFEQTLSPLHTVEMQQVKRDQQRMALTGGAEQELRVLQRHALDLRKARLRRENVEIQFLQREEPAEEAAGLRLMHRQALNTVAIGQIELALKALSRSMR